jgi:hypothetical protein
MLKPLVAAALAAAVLGPVPAHAVHVDNVAGVGSCAARSVSGTRGYCVFAATPGTYQLSISVNSTFGFGWAQVTCLPLGPSGEAGFVSAESPVTYATRSIDIPGGVCTLEVSSSPGVVTYGSVR